MNPADASTDQLLDQILEDLGNRLQAGEALSLERCKALHPDYAEELERLLPAMQALAAVGGIKSDTSARSMIFADYSGVLGDFRIIREIGRGGMGVVYEAEQISVGRTVAIKVLPMTSMLEERALSRFRNEIRAAGLLHHPNIVPIHTVGSDRGVHFYAMQYVAGASVAHVITQQRRSSASSPLSDCLNRPHARDTACEAMSTLRSGCGRNFFEVVATIAIQAADALAHAHSYGVIHRDIKPSNLLLDATGQLWLTDFGLARLDAASDLTLTGDVIGTLQYMSPEQTRGERTLIDHRTDIYSLGATLYELLSQRPPFASADRPQLMRSINELEPKPLRQWNPSVPIDLETIILKSLSKSPADRYASAKHMADDFRRFIERRPIEARRPTFVDRAKKWSRRHAVLVAIATAALAITSAACLAAAAVTYRAYKAEAVQRSIAEGNVRLASEVIDAMLRRAAGVKYVQGDLKDAEVLASDAANFYERLLRGSSDTSVRFGAAQAYGTLTHIWLLLDRHEKAGTACRRSTALLQQLVTSHPGDASFLAALASAHNQRGLIDWSLNRPAAAEPAWREAWEIWSELAQQDPQNPLYQDGVADMLSNLGSICYFTDRFDEAEEYYRRADEIAAMLPAEIRNSTEGLASHAGSLTNQATLARLRGQYDRCIELIHQSMPLHRQSLEAWPTNPVALECYFTCHWNLAEAHLGAKRPAAAASAVEAYVKEFPNRLEAYHQGVEQLLACAALSLDASSNGLTTSATQYRDRAATLVVEAEQAKDAPSDAVIAFAWFLLTCRDKSFRDSSRALKLARDAVSEAPSRGAAWSALSLAHCRNGDFQAAQDAVGESLRLGGHSELVACNWLLLAMIRQHQGQTEKARQLHKKAVDWMSTAKPREQYFQTLADEADRLNINVDAK